MVRLGITKWRECVRQVVVKFISALELDDVVIGGGSVTRAARADRIIGVIAKARGGSDAGCRLHSVDVRKTLGKWSSFLQRAFCLLLGQNAVHAGLSGRTNMVVSLWNHHFTHVPISLAVSERKKIHPEDTLWSSVITSTGQPCDMR